MENKNNELNGFLIFLLVLSIFRNVPNLITAVISSQIYTDVYVILQIVFIILFIIALIGILFKNKYALIGLFLLGISNSVIAFCMGDSGAGFGQLFVIVLWAAMFCLKKNGKSAWKAILFSDKQEEKETEANIDCVDGNIEETPTDSSTPSEMRVNYGNNIIKDSLGEYNESYKESEDDKVIQDNADTIKDKQEEASENADNPQKQLNDPTNSFNSTNNLQNSIIESHTKRFSKKWIIICAICTIVIIGIVSFWGWKQMNKSPKTRLLEAIDLLKEEKIDEAIPILTDLVEEDYPRAKTVLGHLYFVRKDGGFDPQKGIDYLKDAAQDDTLAILELIKLYSGKKYKGKSFANDEELKKYAELAIEKKCFLGRAYFELGMVYFNQNKYSNAYYFWQKATEYNSCAAYRNIGILYYQGWGCPINFEKAKEYFTNAYKLNQNDDITLFYIGIMYEYGHGFPEDLVKAKDFLERSANEGNEWAQEECAEMEMNNDYEFD